MAEKGLLQFPAVAAGRQFLAGVVRWPYSPPLVFEYIDYCGLAEKCRTIYLSGPSSFF